MAERDARTRDAERSTAAKQAGGEQTEQQPGRSRRFTGAARRRDADIRAELDAMLARTDDFDPNDVDLLVQDGVVVLLGQVADDGTKHRLEELCAGVPGIRELHDQLQVVGGGPSSTSAGLRTEAPRAGRRDGSH